jgi:hypothetical protein
MSQTKEVIFLSTACRPIVHEHQQTGEKAQASEVYRAGNRYKIPVGHPYLAQWLEARVCYPADQAPPTLPPVIPPFISSRRILTADDRTEMRETAREISREVIDELSAYLPKQSWFGRLSAWLTTKKGS